MVRWPAGLHRLAGSGTGNTLRWGPGYSGTGAQPMTPAPLAAYRGKIRGVPLTGGDVQGTIGSGQALTLSSGPQGLGTVWYPVQVTVSLADTAGNPQVLSTAVCQVWQGAQSVPVSLVGTIYSGSGTLALAIPPMTPGWQLIFRWSGAASGLIAAGHVIGTMDAITTG